MTEWSDGEPEEAGRSAAPAPSALLGTSPADGDLPEGIALTVLPAGTRVVTERLPHVRSVAVGCWIGTGSRHERLAVAGASHFLEHLLFKGTARRSASEIARSIEEVGGELNAFTAKEHMCFSVRCLDRDLPLAVDVLADMLTSSTLRRADVDAEREVVLEEIRQHRDTPDDLVHSLFAGTVFGPHPLAREVLGDDTTIAALDRPQLQRWYRRQVVPSNLVVSVAGDVAHDDVVSAVDAALAGWQAPAPRPVGLHTPGPPSAPLVIRQRPTEQTHVVLGGLGLAREDPRRHAAQVLNEALGGGMSSRLFEEVRERRGLAYAVYSYLALHGEGGLFGVYAATASQRVTHLLDVLGSELDRAADGLDAEELARAKGALSGALVLGLEDPESRMSRLGSALLAGVPLRSVDDLLDRIAAVTLADVADVAADLTSRPRTLAVVGTVEDPAALAEHPALAA